MLTLSMPAGVAQAAAGPVNNIPNQHAGRPGGTQGNATRSSMEGSAQWLRIVGPP